MLPPHVNPLATRMHITGNPTASYSMKAIWANIEKWMLGCQALFSRAVVQLFSAKTIHTIEELFPWYWRELKPDSHTYLCYIFPCLYVLQY